MASLSSFLIAVLAFAAAAVGYVRSHSILLTVLLFLAVIMIGRSLQPLLLRAWEKFRRRYFPAPELTEFYAANLPEEGVKSDAVGAGGLRVMAVTEALRPNSKNKPLYLSMVEEATAAMAEDSPLFALRWNTVRERALPQVYVAALCETDGKRMRKCFRTWMRSAPVQKLGTKRMNRDLFLRDGEFTAPDGQPTRCTVFVAFDNSLPSTLPDSGETP